MLGVKILDRWIRPVRRTFVLGQRPIKIILICFLVAVLIHMKTNIRNLLVALYDPIKAIEITGAPGSAKEIPCTSHPGQNCGAGVFGSAIAQMHGCCGSFSSLSDGNGLSD